MEPISTKTGLLQAAAGILHSDGARRLTLEKVAAAAGISKGGLLYHFPSKRALLEALVQAGLQEFEQAIQRRQAEGSGWLTAYLGAALASGETDVWSEALIGPMVEDPALLEPVRQAARNWYEQARQTAGPAGQLLLLALDGLYLHQLAGLGDAIDLEKLGPLLTALAETGVLE